MNCLLVIPHPDDETLYGATLWRLCREKNFHIDAIIITDGQGGYSYSQLSSFIYSLDMVDSRKDLISIRKKEMEESAKVIGLKGLHFLMENDKEYTKDVLACIPHERSKSIWETDRVKREIKNLLMLNKYDVVFVMLPAEESHGHHKASCVLTIESIIELKGSIKRPLVIAGREFIWDRDRNCDIHAPIANDVELKNNQISPFDNFSYKGFFEMEELSPHPFVVPKIVNRESKYINNLKREISYETVVSWMISCHKSQGSLFDELKNQKVEEWWCLKINETEEQLNLFNNMFDGF